MTKDDTQVSTDKYSSVTFTLHKHEMDLFSKNASSYKSHTWLRLITSFSNTSHVKPRSIHTSYQPTLEWTMLSSLQAHSNFSGPWKHGVLKLVEHYYILATSAQLLYPTNWTEIDTQPRYLPNWVQDYACKRRKLMYESEEEVTGDS
jgi:hypothetical protein